MARVMLMRGTSLDLDAVMGERGERSALTEMSPGMRIRIRIMRIMGIRFRIMRIMGIRFRIMRIMGIGIMMMRMKMVMSLMVTRMLADDAKQFFNRRRHHHN